MNDQMLIDYSLPSWPECVRLILAESIDWTLLFMVFGALGPVHLGSLVSFGLILTLLQIMLWWLVEGIIEVVSHGRYGSLRYADHIRSSGSHRAVALDMRFNHAIQTLSHRRGRGALTQRAGLCPEQ